jgi:hypothetical protein
MCWFILNWGRGFCEPLNYHRPAFIVGVSTTAIIRRCFNLNDCWAGSIMAWLAFPVFNTSLLGD